MTPEGSKDQDMEKATTALLRAAKRARKLAQQTGTAVVVVRDGKLIREMPGNDSQDQRIVQRA